MKKIKRLLALCLCGAMCAVPISTVAAAYYEVTEYGVYGTKERPLAFPVTEEFMSRKSAGDYHMWYNNEFFGYYVDNYTHLEVLSTIWLEWHDFNGPEKLCGEYRERFADILSKTKSERYSYTSGYGAEPYRFSVDSHSWNGSTLTLQFSADFDISYHFWYDDEWYEHNISLSGNVRPIPYLAVTDKSDGALAELGRIPGIELLPELRYGKSHSINDPEYIPEDVLEMIYADTTVNYGCTATKSVDVQMPEYFDPDKYDVAVYFKIGYDTTEFEFEPVSEYQLLGPVMIADPVRGDPVRGDADASGKLDLLDVTLVLKYLAAWENIVIDETLADTNGDDRVNLSDVSVMLQIIAGWDV